MKFTLPDFGDIDRLELAASDGKLYEALVSQLELRLCCAVLSVVRDDVGKAEVSIEWQIKGGRLDPCMDDRQRVAGL